MTQYTIGDLSQSNITRMQSTRIKLEMLKLTQELSSGEVADIGSHLGGDMRYFADVENNLRLLGGYDLANSEAGHFADATQTVLDRISTITGDSLTRILPAITSTNQDIRDHAASQAQADLETIINSLNTSSAGRSLFAGTATDQQPLIDSGDFMATLKAALPPITDAATLIVEVGNWFSSATGYDSAAYQGSTTDLAPVQVTEDERVSLSVRADAPELKAVLENLALAALATDPAYGLSAGEQSIAYDQVTAGLLAAQPGVTDLQSTVGAAQERIEIAAARNSSARLGFEEARASLVGADPFDVATRLDDVQVRLEALYAVTARMSRLSLVNYI